MTLLESKIGIVCPDFDTFKLKDILVKNDAGEWGADPDENAIGVLRSTNFTNEGKLTLDDVAYRKLSIDKINEKLLSANDILVERSGGSDTQPVGRVGFISEQIAKDKYAFANFIQRISLDDTVVSKYVYYCLQQMYEMGITASMQNQTTGIRNLDWKFYTQSIFPKPSLDEQKAIATILSKIDEAIETTKQTINSAQKLKTSLMQNLLTGKIKPDGTKRKDDEFYYDEKLGKVPKGWDIESLNKLFNINEESLSTNTEPEFTFKYISIEMVDTEKINYEKCPIYNFKDAPGRARRVVKDNDILISGVRPNLKSFAIYNKPDSDNWIVTTGIYVLSAKKDVCSNYFFYQILSEIAEKQFHSYVAGTNYPAIGDRDLKRLKLLVPCYTEQKEISEKFKEVSELIKVKEIKLNKLEKLKKSLMQNLLTGKMRLDEKLIKELISHV
ncbi:restriction endonuclease subunit S [Aliarcobacter butzleri]|uniref:restriction endonuclease subunit S n=1 Tax=Aliarcobacter butzleri TaxID=28197 RepID=UPI001EDBC054|nr:restriction endonuclease subunit S [Aliarcobacter butzleri]MCG3656400.1 restriction endonuclease subunit S [Aliarcobacter butzleri]MDK2050848.1 restriction endonuclease subunit S [Aliarcobacter butzleri]